MTIRFTLAALAVVAAFAAPAAQAAYTIDTGTPTNGLAMANTVDSVNWLAEKFTLSSALTIDQIRTFVMSTDAGDVGHNFKLAVYANSTANLPAMDFYADNNGQLFQTAVTYSGNGWNASATNLNWQLNAGTYWFALEADSSGPTYLVAPVGAPNKALAVASYADGIGGYALTGTSPADTFGLQVTAAVPEPATVALMLAGVALLGLRRRAPSRA